MDDKPNLKVVTRPEAFFHELVTQAMNTQHVKASPETEFYLVHLLNQFMLSDRLTNEPLVYLVKEAFEATEPEIQSKLFTQIGDVSLYTAGFFQDSLNRKLVDVDYYIDMGGNAYRHAAVRVQEPARKNIYEELAFKFGSFVEVLAQVGDVAFKKTEQDILRLYELWIKTGSERAAKLLQESGIIPNSNMKKTGSGNTH